MTKYIVVAVVLAIALLTAACGAGGTEAKPPANGASTASTPQVIEPPRPTSPTVPSTTLPPSNIPLATTTTVNQQCPRSYEVQSGDYLSLIAQRHPGVSVDSIRDLNRAINEDGLIFVGQEICIPLGTTPAAAPITPTSKCLNKSYIVKSGDSLSSIAENFPGVSADNIFERNRDILENKNSIMIGQELCIRLP